MTSAEIRAKIRRGINEFAVLTCTDDTIDDVVLDGVAVFGLEIKQVAPLFFNKRKSLTSSTHVFASPSDCVSIINVRDLRTNAKTITGATNAEPIVVTSAAHGFSDDDIVVVQDVTGNTSANGTWKVANKDADTFELYGSEGNADYVSGGKMFKEATNFTWIEKKEPSEINLDNKSVWYPRERNIVIGKYDFENDILVEYISFPDSVEDIPTEYHIGLVAYGVTNLIVMPDSKSIEYLHKKRSLEYHTSILELTFNQIRTGCAVSVDIEPIYFTPGE